MTTPAPHDWIVPDWPSAPRVRALVTTRTGGVSRGSFATLNLGTRVGDDPAAVEHNREILRSRLPADPIWLQQVHGTDVVDAESAGALPRADGAVARTRHCVCAVLTADCVPVLLADRDGAAVGVAHAGWRGLASGVIEATLARMAVPAKDVIAWLGPGIGPRAYEVGPDVYDAFVARDPGAAVAFEPHGDGKFRADLFALARRRLETAGVGASFGGGLCTYTNAARFYSYRREKASGRFASVIWID
ncbi:MAG TPA: peptidoglycan editing factor PgeF [Burkholderiales bacterium]|nr:peptidoglycan editing factor PgeF [Burkholderiales bacterium]